jgi:integrase
MSVILREKKLKSGGKSLYLDIYHDGERSYQFLNIIINPKKDDSNSRKEKLDIAKQIRNNIELELIAGGTDYVPKHRNKIDFLEYCESYILKYKSKDKRMIICAVRHFANFIGGQRFGVSRLTTKVCEDYLDYLRSDEVNLSGETPKNYFSRFKKVVKAAVSEGYLKINPAQGIIYKNGNNKSTLRKEVLTADELRLLAATPCPNPLVKKMFLFCSYTGLGIADLKELYWENLAGGRLNTRRVKTGIEINIPLSQQIINLAGPPRLKKDLVFEVNLTTNGINKNLHSWVKRAGIDKHITFYCARHSYATLLLMNGANLKTVSDCMGQTSTLHTVKYLNHIEALKDKAINSLPIIEFYEE